MFGWFKTEEQKNHERRLAGRDATRRENKCLCGADGVMMQTYDHPALGGVPWEFPRCAAHKHVSLNTPWRGGVPQDNQTREECNWKSWNIWRVTASCGCGTHVGDKSQP